MLLLSPPSCSLSAALSPSIHSLPPPLPIPLFFRSLSIIVDIVRSSVREGFVETRLNYCKLQLFLLDFLVLPPSEISFVNGEDILGPPSFLPALPFLVHARNLTIFTSNLVHSLFLILVLASLSLTTLHHNEPHALTISFFLGCHPFTLFCNRITTTTDVLSLLPHPHFDTITSLRILVDSVLLLEIDLAFFIPFFDKHRSYRVAGTVV